MRFLVTEGKADVDQADSDGTTTLQAAATYGHRPVVRVLVRAGASGSPNAMVRSVRREELLLEAGAEPPKQVRLYLSGPAAVGKSTLMRSLGRSRAESLLNRGSTADPTTKLEDRDDWTPGVDVKRVDVPGVGWLSMWDFAGQPEYYMSHGLLMGSSSIYLVICSLHDPPQTQQDDVMFWLRFIRAQSLQRPADDAMIDSGSAQGSNAAANGGSIQQMPIVVLAGSCRECYLS